MNVCFSLLTNQNWRSLHVIRKTLHKMAEEIVRPSDRTFQFIDEIHNNPDLWDISSNGYKDTENIEPLILGKDKDVIIRENCEEEHKCIVSSTVRSACLQCLYKTDCL